MKTKRTINGTPRTTDYRFATKDDRDEMLDHARGAYQRALIHGYEPWSGAGLAGKARSYAGSYRTSRESLADRMGGEMILFLDEKSRRWKKACAVDGVIFN